MLEASAVPPSQPVPREPQSLVLQPDVGQPQSLCLSPGCVSPCNSSVPAAPLPAVGAQLSLSRGAALLPVAVSCQPVRLPSPLPLQLAVLPQDSGPSLIPRPAQRRKLAHPLPAEAFPQAGRSALCDHQPARTREPLPIEVGGQPVVRTHGLGSSLIPPQVQGLPVDPVSTSVALSSEGAPFGSSVPAIWPASVSLSGGGGSQLPTNFGLGCPKGFQRTVSQCLATAYCLLFPVTTLGELTVLAHTDGDTTLAVGPEVQDGQAVSQERKAELLLSQVLTTTHIVFPAGWAGDHQVKVLVAPIPIAPPAHTIVRTRQQRVWNNAHQPGLYFMLVAALVGGTSYEAAATAYSRAASFRQTVASATEATLAGTVMMQAVRFRFGARELTSVARGQDPAQCEVGSLSELTIKSLLAEAQLRDALFSFSNPSDPLETFMHEWGAAVQAFDPAEMPEGSCKELPTLQQRSLMDVPLSHDPDSCDPLGSS